MSGFLAASECAKEIARMALLVRPLAVNVLISGGAGCGKTTLAKEIGGDAAVVSGENEDEIAQIAARAQSLIIENFDRVSRPDHLEIGEKRIVATAVKQIDQNIIDRYFGMTLYLPPLSERHEDVLLLAGAFLEEAKHILGISAEIDINKIEIDLSENARSLRRSVYIALVIESFGEKEIMSAMGRFLRGKMRGKARNDEIGNETRGGGSNLYRDFLYLYDLPLIKAGLEEYGSQLQLSSALGINRNTLRKKVYELSL